MSVRRQGKAHAPRPVAAMAALEAYVPGEARLEGRKQVHKLSANESPFGASAAAQQAYRAAARRLHHYPDGSAGALRRALARRYGIEPTRIVCGHGSGELLYLLARLYLAPQRIGVCSQYGFALYALVIRTAGARLAMVPAPNLRTDLPAMARRAAPASAVIFLANPNNPTGDFVPLKEIAGGGIAGALPLGAAAGQCRDFAQFFQSVWAGGAAAGVDLCARRGGGAFASPARAVQCQRPG